jgi:hypothetical protein
MNIVVYNWFELCVLVLIICDEMGLGFYIYSTQVVVCHKMFCIPVVMHGHSTSVYIKNHILHILYMHSYL